MQLCGFDVGLDKPFFLIAGTCSIEGLEMSLDVAGQLKEISPTAHREAETAKAHRG